MKIKDIIISVLELDIEHNSLADETSLYSPTVGLDSLNLLHILVAVEKQFNVEIDDEDVMGAELSDVGSLIAMVRGAIDAKGAGD